MRGEFIHLSIKIAKFASAVWQSSPYGVFLPNDKYQKISRFPMIAALFRRLRQVVVLSALLSDVYLCASADPVPVTYSDSIVSLDEISVSAIKAVSVTTFPSSATAIGKTEVERYDLDDLEKISEIAPNFYMPQYGSRMTSSIYVRGLGTRIDQPVVALNVDNVPMMTKDAYDFSLPDLWRIEMVRGAQSILYGRNTMGGVINLSTLSPMAFQGLRAKVEYGSGNTWHASAGAYMKPSDKLGIAVLGAYNSTDGFFRNLYSGEKVDYERQGMAKMKLSWRPSSEFMLENSAWTTVTRQGGYPYESLATGEINHNDTCFYRRTSVIDGLTMRYIGENLSVSSITGFQYLNDNMTLDQDFLPEDYFTLTQKRHEWSLTQDFVAKGQSGQYKYLGGAFGFYKRTNMSAPVTFKDDGIKNLIEDPANAGMAPMKMQLRWDERRMLLASDFLIPTWGWALYHKSEYSVGGWTASLGLRLAFERTTLDYDSRTKTAYTVYRDVSGRLIPIMHQDVDLRLTDRLHMTSLELLPELKISYNLSEDLAIGAIVSKGHKSGGYNTQMFSDILQQALMGAAGQGPSYDVDEVISYKPEYSWNYELNFAANLFARRLSVDATLFYIDCRDQQMTVFPEGTTTGRMMANAGKTRSLGVELSAAYRLSSQWNFNVSYGLADAKFRSFNNGIVDCKGNHVPYAPENTMFLSMTYSPSFNSRIIDGIEATASCRGVGRIYWDEENSVSQPFYALMGLSVTVKTPWADIDLWGENLTGTRYSTFYFESIGNRFVQRGNPRRLGVTLRMAFDAQ